MKNIIITGASSGIGKSLAIEYSKIAENILLIARNKSRLEETVKLCDDSAKISFEIIDVSDSKTMNNAINNFDQKHPIDLVIANSGISAGTGTKGESLNQLQEIYSTNINGVANTIYPAINKMIERKKGHIAIMSSMSAFIPIPSAPAYSSSKQCVSFLGKALRHNLKKYNITLSIIYPGFVSTPMTDANKFKMPLIISSQHAAKIIKVQLFKKKTKIIFPKIIFIFSILFNLLPNFIKSLFFNKIPAKGNIPDKC